MEAFKSRIYLAYSKVVASNKELTTANLKFKLFGREEVVKIHTLIEAVIEHNAYFESMIGVKYCQGSYKNDKTTLKYLIEFVPQYYKKKDIPLKDVNHKVSFVSYCMVINRCRKEVV